MPTIALPDAPGELPEFRAQMQARAEQLANELRDVLDAVQAAEEAMRAQPPRGRGIRLAPEEARDTAIAMGEFTLPEVARRLGVTTGAVRRALTPFLGVSFQETGERRSRGGGPGRPSPVYRYVPPSDPGAAFRAQRAAMDRRPVELRVVREAPRRGYAQPAAKQKPRTSSKELAALLDRAREAGCLTERASKHVRVITPTGETLYMPATPSDPRSVKNCAAQLRRAGVPVSA